MWHSRWIHFSRLPFLPEIDALKEDLSIINDIFQHLQISQDGIEKSYVEAYKYAFSRKGKLILSLIKSLRHMLFLSYVFYIQKIETFCRGLDRTN